MNRRPYLSVHLMKHFVTLLKVDVLDMCGDRFSKKAQACLIKFIPQQQLLFETANNDLELITRQMIAMINIPWFRKRPEFTHLTRLIHGIGKQEELL